MQFDIITIFPNIFDSYLNTSIISRAQKKKLVRIKIHNLRKWATDKRKTIDDKPYSGGPGMIFKIEPIYSALKSLNKVRKTQKIVLLTPKGKQFNQKIAKRLSKNKRIILVCGRYEGFDYRIKNFVDEQISIGPYILSGGEVAAMALIEAIVRLIPGVIKQASLKKESFSLKSLINIEYPQYTRPREFTYKNKFGKIKKLKVPKILFSGDHKKIEKWEEDHVHYNPLY